MKNIRKNIFQRQTGLTEESNLKLIMPERENQGEKLTIK